MKRTLYTAAAVILAASLVVSHAQTSGSTAPAKKHAPASKPAAPTEPSVQDQIQALRTEMQTQIDSLKSDLAAKDVQLQKAEQDAADARAAANKAEADAQAQQQAFGDNASAVTTLQSTVSDLKTNALSLATTVSDETTNIKKAIANPDAIMFKGVTLSPTGSFLAAETVWRSGATGGDINTAFTGIPLQNSEGAQLTEFFMSGRQSRAALRATGKFGNVTATGYYEADWLSSGTTSNNNQSNSYTLRQRQLWADAKTASGWDFSGGQGWSLATETTQGLTRGTEILPSTIDAQYEAGFVWTRQASFRLSKSIANKVFIGASAENAETLNPGGSGLPLNVLIGSGGTSGGLYNAASNPTTATALANYTFNYSPDWVAKMAIEPGWGHWELFELTRFFRDRIYPGLSCSTAGTPAITTCTGSTAGAYNDEEVGYGFGGGFRGSIANKKITIGLKGLWGYGVGRYGSSTIADITLRPNGVIEPLEAFSALSTIELNPNPKLNVYFNYGGDYIYRDFVLNSSNSEVGYGLTTAAMSSCSVEPTPGNGGVNQSADPTGAGGSCAGNNKDVQEFTAGYWFTFLNNPHGRLRQGIQYSLMRRDLWSGATSTANPGAGAHGDDNMIFTSFRYYLP